MCKVQCLKYVLIVFVLASFFPSVFAQQAHDFAIQGVVLNDRNEALKGASVYLQEAAAATITDENGVFRFKHLDNGTYRLHVSYVGYRCIHPYHFTIDQHDADLTIIMEPTDIDLQEVVITSDVLKGAVKEQSQAVETADKGFISRNRGSSLMSSLQTLPGVQAMEIGQGLSKPVIRGLGFNRVVVSENNIKVEGQQWGADHGLEVDQFGVEKLEVIKGPSSLIYGSDALGGVVQIKPHALAAPGHIETEVATVARSVNDLIGGSAMLRLRKSSFFAYLRFTHTRFGDYKVPADSFFYNRYRFAIPDQKLKNTAGAEQNFYTTVGLIKKWGKLAVSASNVYSKTGFFPGAHGLPSAEKLADDGSSRNIELPFQNVNHFKLSSNALISVGRGKLTIDWALQDNHRQEWSLFHSHYPNQTLPVNNPDLELEWKLRSLAWNTNYKFEHGRNQFQFGFSAQHQENKIGGYTFLLPAYQRFGVGVFYTQKFQLNERLQLNGGLRYDYGTIQIDQYISPYTGNQKAPDFNGVYRDLSWAFGMIYQASHQLLMKANLAKSFRMPGASELGSNGVHHGSFRYELGDVQLNSEYAYQLDASVSYETEKWQISLSPFAGYFPNFIYLNPTGSYLLPDGSEIEEADAGQIYRYEQSEAYRYGGEALFGIRLSSLFDLNITSEYIFTTDGKYPIPFTPPLRTIFGVDHHLPAYWKKLHNTLIRFEYSVVSAQNNVARNELKTPGYQLFNLSFSTKVLTRYFPLGIDFQAQNLFNTRYFNHLSFYRHLGLPEPGRNFQITLTIPLDFKM